MDHSGDNDAGSGTGFSDIRPGNVASFSAENDRLPEMSGSGAAKFPAERVCRPVLLKNSMILRTVLSVWMFL